MSSGRASEASKRKGAGVTFVGELGRRVAAKDWSLTPFGPIESWHPSLLTSLNIVLASQHPSIIFWGPELCLLYNDACRSILGTEKHPRALGQRAELVWAEVWDDLRPILEQGLGGRAAWVNDMRLDIARDGHRTESYFTISSMPILAQEGRIGGILCVIVETTHKVVGDRRVDRAEAASAEVLIKKAASEGSESPASKAGGSGFDASPSSSAGAQFHIVVADDHADMRAYLERLLRPLGEVLAVSDGVQALAAVRSRAPDLVLADVMMPNLDGFGLLRALRDDDSTKDLPIVLLSARSGEDARIEGIRAGADDYLTKPFPARELYARVRTQILLARQRKQAESERAIWIEERAQFLARAELLDELREADRRKNEFIAVLSHELRNPLAPIKNSLHVLEAAAPGSDNAKRAMRIIDRQVNQLARLVDDLLDVTRITQNKIQLQRQRVDLNEIVLRTVEDNRSIFERKSVNLSVNLSDAPVFVDGDSARLSQVVSNLLQNAAKFTPASGATAVTVARDEAAERAVVRVADTGVGIEEAMLERLFQPFMQADTTLDRTNGGLGLGLALVKGLVELHGGEVSASSEGLDKGSELVVRIPLDARSAPPSEPPVLSVPRSPLRVLIIEDNRDAADSLRGVLSQYGCDVEVAYDGTSGIDNARRLNPDVVFCDIGLPGISGYEVAKALRADEARRKAVLVALTGYALPEDRERAKAAGFDHHLAKPASLDRLKSVLMSVPPREAR